MSSEKVDLVREFGAKARSSAGEARRLWRKVLPMLSAREAFALMEAWDDPAGELESVVTKIANGGFR